MDDLAGLLVGERAQRLVPVLVDGVQPLVELARWPADLVELVEPPVDERVGLLVLPSSTA